MPVLPDVCPLLEWFKIDPDPSLGGVIALSIEVPSNN